MRVRPLSHAILYSYLGPTLTTDTPQSAMIRMPICSNHSDLTNFPAGDSCSTPIKSIADWEVRRRDIMVGVQALMGELPSRSHLPPLDVQFSTTLTTPSYVRHSLSFIAEHNDQVERTPAFVYAPREADDDDAWPTILATHPTSELGKRWSDGRNPPLNYPWPSCTAWLGRAFGV